MVKRICPVCDQVMKGKHYCPVCRRFVKHPWIVENHYYLNECHPSFETDCEYHNPVITREKLPQKIKTTPVRPMKAGTRGPVYTPASGNKKGGNPVISAIIIIFAVMFLISLLSAIIPLMVFFL